MANSTLHPQNTLLYYTLGGGMVALVLFLTSFILTSRAKTPDPRSNLRIPVPPVPEYQLPSPNPEIIIIEPLPATETAQPTIEPVPELEPLP